MVSLGYNELMNLNEFHNTSSVKYPKPFPNWLIVAKWRIYASVI